MLDIVARLKARLDEIVYRAYLDIFGKRVFPAVIGEETLDMDYDVSKDYKGNKGKDMYRGSV